ncbi:MAG: hypothetical protein QOG10_2055 [Kribbellaceae bacterium]|nr:hypothetical protein [Kribbellaceae bacterium]
MPGATTGSGFGGHLNTSELSEDRHAPPATVGRTIALTNWSLYALPQRNLEGMPAHELAHHLALPQRVSLLGQGSQLGLKWLAGRAVGAESPCEETAAEPQSSLYKFDAPPRLSCLQRDRLTE